MRCPFSFEDKIVLEVGVGTGKTLSAILLEKPKSVFAFDFSSEALKHCRHAFKGFKEVSFVKADVLDLPFEKDFFDVAVVYYVLDNMLEAGRKKAVRELHRVLKPGGVLLFEDFAVGDFRETTSKRIGMPESHTLLKKKGLLCHYFTKAEVKGLFKEFKSVEVSGKERAPIRNRSHLVRKTVSAVAVK
jgi:tRNAThr (cytosine32-N3)-methyltransferase